MIRVRRGNHEIIAPAARSQLRQHPRRRQAQPGIAGQFSAHPITSERIGKAEKHGERPPQHEENVLVRFQHSEVRADSERARGETPRKGVKLIRNRIDPALAALVLLFAVPGFAQKADVPSKPKPDAAKSLAASSEKGSADKPGKIAGLSILHIEVTAGEKDQAVDNASVYVRFPEARILGREKLVEMNVKTNREGLVKVTNVPRGKALIQVIASGWKTFGRWFDLSKDEETIKIKLEKPPRWY